MSWSEQVTFGDMIMVSTLYQINRLTWICLDMRSGTLTHQSDSQPASHCSFSLPLRAYQRSNKCKFIIFCLVQVEFEPIIDHIRDGHANPDTPKRSWVFTRKQKILKFVVQKCYLILFIMISLYIFQIVEIYILRDNEIKGRNPSKWLLASWLFLFTAIIIRYKNNLIVDISEVYTVLDIFMTCFKV